MGTKIMLCCRCLGPSVCVLPMKIHSLQRGSMAPKSMTSHWKTTDEIKETLRILWLLSKIPLVHHLWPLMTYSLPSRRMELWIFVASDDATYETDATIINHSLLTQNRGKIWFKFFLTPGSVIPKHERISPFRSGFNHFSLCSCVPYRTNTSMFPVSGALQLKTYKTTLLKYSKWHDISWMFTRFYFRGCHVFSHLFTEESVLDVRQTGSVFQVWVGFLRKKQIPQPLCLRLSLKISRRCRNCIVKTSFVWMHKVQCTLEKSMQFCFRILCLE